MHLRSLLSALLAALLLTATTAAAGAAPRVLLVDGQHVRSEASSGAQLADAAPTPASAARNARTTISAARAPKKKTAKPKKKAKPAYDLKVIRRKINGTGASVKARYDARAALTSLYNITRKSPKSSQARREGEGVLKVVTQMARGNRISDARLPLLTETMRRNAEWWKLRKSTGSGQRVRFEGSQMLWQLYPGSGLQLQWLGTFGRGNSLFYSGGVQARADFGRLVDEAVAYAVPRAGGVAWEYMFPFGGGSPPWASGMAQATGIQVLSRASTKLARPELLAVAKQALGIMRTAPPQGVQLVDETGSHYLIYSFAPSLKVLNAMNQTVNGLYAYVLAAPDDVDARLMLLSGLTWLDANLPKYDTGKWTKYALGGSLATPHYHGVALGFLKTLCALLKADAAMPGGGPTGAYSSTRICNYAATFSDYAKRGKPKS